MAERSGPVAQREAFIDLAEALARYLEAQGWAALVVGDARIQPAPDGRDFHYEFVVRFTGGQKRGAVSRGTSQK